MYSAYRHLIILMKM